MKKLRKFPAIGTSKGKFQPQDERRPNAGHANELEAISHGQSVIKTFLLPVCGSFVTRMGGRKGKQRKIYIDMCVCVGVYI